jgi:hypothetical protein
MSQDVTDAQVAMLRGVKNCGQHHEENATMPAVWFVQSCDLCAGHIFAVIWNAGVKAEMEEAIRIVRRGG